jgi:hypothetical protein
MFLEEKGKFSTRDAYQPNSLWALPESWLHFGSVFLKPAVLVHTRK